jgi:hypothetical protein
LNAAAGSEMISAAAVTRRNRRDLMPAALALRIGS